MANHAEVRTRRKLNDEILLKLLNEVNEERFGGKIAIEEGDDCFIIRVSEYQYRLIWVNKSKNVELRHGGGSDFIWWIDNAFMDELAVKLNGTRYDDGTGVMGKGESGKYPTFRDWMDGMTQNNDNPDIRNWRIHNEMRDALREAPHLKEFMGEEVSISKEKLKQIEEALRSAIPR
jgi:hypothetical protein